MGGGDFYGGSEGGKCLYVLRGVDFRGIFVLSESLEKSGGNLVVIEEKGADGDQNDERDDRSSNQNNGIFVPGGAVVGELIFASNFFGVASVGAGFLALNGGG